MNNETAEQKLAILLDTTNNNRFDYVLHISTLLNTLQEKMKNKPQCCQEAAAEIMAVAVELCYKRRVV